MKSHEIPELHIGESVKIKLPFYDGISAKVVGINKNRISVQFSTKSKCVFNRIDLEVCK